MKAGFMDEVWKMVYDSFEQGTAGAWKTVTGSNTMRNEVQFRLQKNIAEYKQNQSAEVLGAIAGDIQLCGSLGFMTQETTDKALSLLDTL